MSDHIVDGTAMTTQDAGLVEASRLCRSFWISWWHPDDLGAFTLHWPWWISGTRGEDDTPSICAAVQAESAEAAINIIRESFDTFPDNLEWRFVLNKPIGWTPYSSRFQKGDWMPEWHVSDLSPESQALLRKELNGE